MTSRGWVQTRGSEQQNRSQSQRPRRAEEGVLTNLAHVEGPVGPAAHSIQSRVHSAQGHQGWRICVQLELDSLPRTVLLAAVHFQLQLAEAGMGAVRLRRAFSSLSQPDAHASHLSQC